MENGMRVNILDNNPRLIRQLWYQTGTIIDKRIEHPHAVKLLVKLDTPIKTPISTLKVVWLDKESLGY